MSPTSTIDEAHAALAHAIGQLISAFDDLTDEWIGIDQAYGGERSRMVLFVVWMGSTRARQSQRQAAIRTIERLFIQEKFAFRTKGMAGSQIREHLIQLVLDDHQTILSGRKTP